MKKFVLLVTSLLAISVASLTGCNMDKVENDVEKARNRITDIIQDVIPDTNSDTDCDDGDCNDGNCEDGNCKNGEFGLTQPIPRMPHLRDDNGRTITGDGNNDEDNGEQVPPPPKARRPRRERKHGNTPIPTPLPAHPEN